MKSLPIYGAAALWLACAGATSAEERIITGSELLMLHDMGGTTRKMSSFYVTGILDALVFNEHICVPKGLTTGEATGTVLHTIGEFPELQKARMSTASITAAKDSFPCDD